MNNRDMGAPFGPGYSASPEPVPVSALRASIPSAVPLSNLSKDERKRMTGRAFELPSAKGASEPYYYNGVGPAPVVDGTPISVWHFNERDPINSSYWIPSKSTPVIWQKPCVFRVRKLAQTPAPIALPAQDVSLLIAISRVADGLLAIAQAIEARRAETHSGSVHESAVPAGDAPNTDGKQPGDEK